MKPRLHRLLFLLSLKLNIFIESDLDTFFGKISPHEGIFDDGNSSHKVKQPNGKNKLDLIQRLNLLYYVNFALEGTVDPN